MLRIKNRNLKFEKSTWFNKWENILTSSIDWRILGKQAESRHGKLRTTRLLRIIIINYLAILIKYNQLIIQRL
jgi:hypothetical protein